MNRHYRYLLSLRREISVLFFSLGSNHIKFFTYQMVERKELPPLFDT